jgi:hypothetical protein
MAYIDFKIARNLASMEELLAKYGVRLKVSGDSLRCRCPLPSHKQPENHDTFSASISKNVWSCKSESCIKASGRKGGNTLDFVMLMERGTLQEAAQKLVEWFGERESAPHMERRDPVAPNGNNQKDQPDHSKPVEPVKLRYMEQIDQWFDVLIIRGDLEEEADYWHRIRNGVKSKLIESFKSGKAAAQSPVPAK